MVADMTKASALAANIIRCAFPDVDIPEVSLTEFVLGKAAERGDKPAIIDGPTGRTVTYAQLVSLVRRVAAGLAAHGFQKGDVLGIYSPNVPEYTIAFHAAASLGGTITTVNPLYTVRELAQQLVPPVPRPAEPGRWHTGAPEHAGRGRHSSGRLGRVGQALAGRPGTGGTTAPRIIIGRDVLEGRAKTRHGAPNPQEHRLTS